MRGSLTSRLVDRLPLICRLIKVNVVVIDYRCRSRGVVMVLRVGATLFEILQVLVPLLLLGQGLTRLLLNKSDTAARVFVGPKYIF